MKAEFSGETGSRPEVHQTSVTHAPRPEEPLIPVTPVTQDANDFRTDPVVACELKSRTKMELFRLAKRAFEYLV